MAMGLKVDISLLGEKDLMKALDKLENKLKLKIMRREMRKSMKIVQKAAKAKALAVDDPGTPHDIMKKVAKGIRLRAAKRSRRHIGIQVQTPPRAKLGLPPWSATGPGRFYDPAHIELGTKKMAGKRYLRNALLENEQAVYEALRKGIWAGIKEEVAKMPKGGS